ncbi:YopD family type III secretion system translocon subunit [Aeromonas aquatilis]
MSGINNDYLVGSAYIPPIINEGVDESQSVTRSNTKHEAGNIQGINTPVQQDRPELISPNKELDVGRLAKGSSELDDTMSLMILLLEMARRAREMGLLQRDMENQAVISAQKDQVSEMRSGAKLMIAMAVVSGVMTGFSAIMGGVSSVKSAKGLKQDKLLNADIVKQQKDLDGLTDLKKAQGKELGAGAKDLAADLQKKTADLQHLNKKFDINTSRSQHANTVIQGISQMSNSAVQVQQGISQADAKEDEVHASVSQTEKQKVEDHINFQNNFMKDVLQMMQQYAQSHNQAMRAAFGVA